jgi:Family of unknown function (DUF5681)
MPREQAPQYEVGYGRPPVAHQFKKGQSGNPTGRRKGSLSVEPLVLKELKRLVVVQEGGRRRSISKLEAAAKQVANKAASGDFRSLKFLFERMDSPAWKAMHETEYPSQTEDARERVTKRLEQVRQRLEEAKYLQSAARDSRDVVPPDQPPRSQTMVVQAAIPEGATGRE